MARKRRLWASPRKPSPPKIPDTLKRRLQADADRLVAEVLKPRYVQPPRGKPELNHVVDVFTRWFRSYFYFCETYACPNPNAPSPSFEARFARMEYAGREHFHMAFMRYTGEWIEIYRDVPLDEALAAIRDDPYFRG